MCDKPSRQIACGDHHRRPPINLIPAPRAEQYSGFIIARLSPELPVVDCANLMELARKLNLQALSAVLDQFDLSTSRRVVRSLSPEKLLRLEKTAAQSELPPLRSLTSYWRIDVRHRLGNVEEILKRLNELVEIDWSYRELSTSDPVVNDADDTYAAGQDYLDAAPTGIDARWAWTQANGEGAGVAFVDLEQGWFPSHEDLVAKSPTLIFGDNRDGIGGYKGNHGAAVLGQVVGVDNTRGIVGAAPGVTSVRMVSHYEAGTNTALHVADAIVAAIPVMSPGDVLLLEVQRSFKPTEIDDADFDAIRLAVALGLIVVEAAGNGNVNLDTLVNAAGDRILNRTDVDFRESGAIMVGAGESVLPHNRSNFSNFGTRIDCYGWGDDITTAGYGDLDPGTGDNSTYTDTFGGTSGASPMIVGATLILQGMYQATTGGFRISPLQMRGLLSNPATGTPQGGGVAGNIGVMPNLRPIISNVLGLVPDIYLRDSVGDTGVVPSPTTISASPDVIVRPAVVANPTLAFGEGSGTENSSVLGYEAEAGQDNYIYVRMKNRGAAAANGATATVYWSEVATLVTPDMWHLIGNTAPVNVPQGNTLVVTNPLTWPAAEIPGTGHYCYVALLDHPNDPAPPLPPGPPLFDWDGFRAFIRNNNNVTWRNFNVVNNIPDPDSEPARLPFLIAGAPDRARFFDLEIIRNLPREAEVWLEAPLAVIKQLLKGRRWPVKIDQERGVAHVQLPAQPRLPFCGVRLPAKARFQSAFFVRGAKGMEVGGHNLAIRQLFENEEVGRVTWQFDRRKE